MPVVTHLREVIARYETETSERLSYQELADKTGLSKATIYRWANNDVRHQILTALCEYFNCQPGDLLTFRLDRGSEEQIGG